MFDVCFDALLDTVKLVPFLFLTYLFMEWIEHKTSEKTKGAIRRAGRLGPAIGGLLGALPQCGFSAAAANLYAGRVITVGTLIAIFLSTSDEMLPIMLSEQVSWQLVLSIVGIKAAIGIAVGFAADYLVRRKRKIEKIEVGISHVCQHEHCHCEKGVFGSAARHTVVITFFILVISLAINMLIFMIGEETVAALILNRPIIGPLLAALVGLIPNCAASVVITQLFLEGLISFGAMMAGLLAGAGVGILILFRVHDNLKKNVEITAIVYAAGVLFGIAMDLLL